MAIVCPARRPSRDGGCAAAWREMRTRVSSVISPFSIASKAIYSVIILVSEAGCTREPALSVSHRNSPVRTSMMAAAKGWA